MTAPLILGAPSQGELHQQLLSTTWRPASRIFQAALVLSIGLTLLLFACIGYLFARGVGVWGNNIPVGWGFPVVNFVWWIGIGHAGTFISAVLYLLEQGWRTSISRFAEAMTLFALIQAAMFPLIHVGRPWFIHWMLPYPSVMGVWPNVRSAFPWDGAAIATYAVVSLLFWYLGMLPDLGALRDSAPRRGQRIVYGVLALGWRGDAHTYRLHRSAYLVLAGLATPLVVSVHSIVSADFAIALTPGWHSTLYPPFFVAGAIYSGFAMVVTLAVPIRAGFQLENVITARHLESCAKFLLATGLMVSYGYIVEMFVAWYSAEPSELYQYFTGRPATPIFWVMLSCNVLIPQLLWSKRVRTSPRLLFVLSLLINVGMWSERFVIVVVSLTREYLPSKWEDFAPTWVDIGVLLGTFGFFSLLMLLFLRFLPLVAATEMKELNATLQQASREGRA
jgi:molybdopterin-containing oxidoreductase family membrane subunit